MVRIIAVEEPRKYSLRIPQHTFDAVIDEAKHNSRSVNAEMVRLIEDALEMRANAREKEATNA